MPDQAGVLSKITVRAKASWGYPATWIDNWREELTITREYIETYDVFVAEFKRRLAGLVSIEITSPIAEIGNLWVDPEYHGHGIGRQLVQHCIDYARHNRLDALLVESDPNALGFYQRVGGVHVESRPAPLPGMPERTLPVLRFELEPFA